MGDPTIREHGVQAVRTTIVGGRPPAEGRVLSGIPRGVEILVKKASVDAEFRKLLIEMRGAAAERIGLGLAPEERILLDAAPREQLEMIIDRARVETKHRAAFMGYAAAVMIAAIGATEVGCDQRGHSAGVQPVPMETTLKTTASTTVAPGATTTTTAPPTTTSRGLGPDVPAPTQTAPPRAVTPRQDTSNDRWKTGSQPDLPTTPPVDATDERREEAVQSEDDEEDAGA